MYDSSGKTVEGLLNGNTNMEGSFASCYEVEVDAPYDSNGTLLESFESRFCTFRLLSEDPAEERIDKRLQGLPSFSPLALETVSMFYYVLGNIKSCIMFISFIY